MVVLTVLAKDKACQIFTALYRLPDQHYAATLFRYQREFVLKFRDSSGFICLDNKHRIKIGEPGSPIAAAERDRRVLVSMAKSFQVGDHDFTKFSVIPSVMLVLVIPPQFLTHGMMERYTLE